MGRACLAGIALCAACAGKDGTTYFGSVTHGDGGVCLGSSGTISGTDTGLPPTLDLVGTVVSDVAATSLDLSPAFCEGSVARVLTLTGSDSSTVELGYGLADVDGTDITPSLDVKAGQDLSVRFESIQSFGTAAAFALTDDTSFLGALDLATWGDPLQAGDIAGLTVADGDTVATVSEDCGPLTERKLDFQGDADTQLLPVSSRLITFGAKAYTAYAVANEDYEGDMSCEDVAGEAIWAVFR